MQNTADPLSPRTTTDMVFDKLHEEISTLELLPGAKISEAEVAQRLGVSRQPVRDAFNRLGNLDLLLIRPQRATLVRGFSIEQIENARFIRLAVELEVVGRACSVWSDSCARALDAVIAEQEAAISANQTDQFHALDYDFHKLICDLGGFPLAFETIEQCKKKIDRLCMLSLGKAAEGRPCGRALPTRPERRPGVISAASTTRSRRSTRRIRSISSRSLEPGDLQRFGGSGQTVRRNVSSARRSGGVMPRSLACRRRRSDLHCATWQGRLSA